MTSRSSPTLTDIARQFSAGIVTPAGQFLHRLGIHPDMVTVTGLLLVAVAAVFVANGQLQAGGVLLVVSLPFDALDGAVARAMNRQGKFGAVLDSTLDRYADAFILAALSYYFAAQARPDLFILAQLALMGSLLVSYVRARADGVQVQASIGWFTRMERSILVIGCLLVPGLIAPGILILAIGTNATALQRLYYVYRILKTQDNRDDV